MTPVSAPDPGNDLAMPAGTDTLKILILGGYGVFGGRLAQLLADLPRLELFIAGRDLSAAKTFCDAFAGQALVRPVQLDRRDVGHWLNAHKPDLVVDASGPFQAYGVNRYRVIEACIAAGIDYLDFADAADFVFGVARFDAAAKAAGIFVLSGVSSFPVLTAAVLREMAKTMDIVTVEGGIAPSPYAGIGLNVMRAVVGYAGAPVKLLRHGRQTTASGLAESRRFTVAVPGRLPLRNLRYSLVDVPDLQVLPPDHPGLTDIWMGAGPVPELLHRMLNLLALARAKFGLPSLAPLSRLFYLVLNQMRFGEHRGGMYVHAVGVSGGRRVEQSWHLLAEGDDGPFIPSMAIESVIRRLLAGTRPTVGARSGVGALALSDYALLFRGRQIFTGFRSDAQGGSLFQRALGSAFARLPPRLAEFHGGATAKRWSGQADVRRGRGFLACIIATIVGFPKAGTNLPISVTTVPENGGERWKRVFDGQVFSSMLSTGKARNEHLIVERFGIAAFALALVISEGRLCLIPRRWSVLGVPMPGFLLPGGASCETEVDGHFQFDVEISAPFIGLIVAYKGLLSPDTAGVDAKTGVAGSRA